MRCTGYAESMTKQFRPTTCGIYSILVENVESARPFESHGMKFENNKTDLPEIGCGKFNWIWLTNDEVQ